MDKKRLIIISILVIFIITLFGLLIWRDILKRNSIPVYSMMLTNSIIVKKESPDAILKNNVSIAIGYIVQGNINGKINSKATSVSANTNTNASSSNSNIVKTSKTAKGKGLPVLMYHFFYNKKAGEKGADDNWMEISDFEAQMKYLSDNNFYFPSWTEVEYYIDGKITLPEKSVVITIDDGDETFIKLAIPIIEKYNVKATSFVVTSWNGNWLPKQYSSSKLDFQSHSHDMHRAGANGNGRFVNLSYNEAIKDVTTSKNIIGNCKVFCYPFGHYNDNAKKVLKDSGYKLAFTTQSGRVYKGANKFELPRIRMSKGMSLNSFKEKVK